MIYAYTGLPGSGKSLTALEFVLSELKAGRHVFCNIVGLTSLMISWKISGSGLIYSTSYVEKYLHRFSMSFGDERADAERFYKKTLKDGSFYYANAEGLNLLVEDIMEHKETVCVIDECHEYLNAENWKVLRPFAKYISMARHYGHDLILITQHITDIWQPLQKRVHETHDFFRGQLGFKDHYKEIVYYGVNILAAPGYKRNRVNDKTLYRLYKSHDGGAKEHKGYISIWKNGRLRYLLFVVLVLGIASFFGLRHSAGWYEERAASPPSSSAASAPEYRQSDNIIYVKYVVCGAFDCKATRPDGTTLTLPLDYASGKYPIEVRKYAPSTNTGISLPFGNGSGVPHAPR